MAKASKRALTARAWQMVGAGGDVAMGLPLVTIEGRHRLRLENHKGLREYSSSKVVVTTQDGSVAVSGHGLNLVSISHDTLIVEGVLTSVSLEQQEAH